MRKSLAFLGLMCVSGLGLLANPASEEAAAWFAGNWKVGPAPVEGFETIAEAESIDAAIRHVEGAWIEREIRLSGQLHVMRFEVRSFGGNFPWWGENGGNYVCQKKSEDAFVLAPVSATGKAEWDKGWLYERAVGSED